jgi:hypothetical protein
MKNTIFALLLVCLCACQKGTLTQGGPPTVAEFKTMLTIDKVYCITDYTDTLGNAIAFAPVTDRDNKYIFEDTATQRNARIYNTTTQTICFVYWTAHDHPNGGIVFEFVDFDLTPTYYTVIEYNTEQGYFKIKTGNILLTYKTTNL